MRIPATGREPCVPTKADGTPAAAGADGAYTLVLATTYYVALGGEDAAQLSIALTPANALLLTSVDLEVTNRHDVSDVSVTAGHWHDTEPTDVKIEGSGTFGDDAGNFPLDKTNGAGFSLVTLPTFPWRRGRLVLVVGAAGGDLRVDCAAKS